MQPVISNSWLAGTEVFYRPQDWPQVPIEFIEQMDDLLLLL